MPCRFTLSALTTLAMVLSHAGAVASTPRPPSTIVTEILDADYRADLPRLLALYEELEAPADRSRVAARIRYWRGFARWRRAINGANDGAPVGQMLDDLRVAEREFEAALDIEPAFEDARAALLSSIGIQLFFSGDPADVPSAPRAMAIAKEVLTTPSGNPRMIWVAGQSLWRTPPSWTPGEVLARQEKVITEYLRGLDLIRSRPAPVGDGLDPRWGEAELLMNLAWSSLNKVAPDPAAAERYAREALALVPHWHYVRDILLPQILTARKGGGGTPPRI